MCKNKYVLPVSLLLLILIVIFLAKKNNRALLDYGEDSTVEILDIFRKKKGISTSETVAEIRYRTHKGLIKKMVPLQPKMKIGKCYPIRYSSKNVKIVRIDVSREVNCAE